LQFLQLLFISIICIWIQLKVCYIFNHMSHHKRLCEEDPFVPTAGQPYAIKSLSLLMTAETPPMTGSSLGSHGSCVLASYGAMTNSTPSTLSTWYRHWKQVWINLAYKSFWLSKTPTETFDKSDKEPKLLPWELICHCRQYINYPLQLPMRQLLMLHMHQLQGTHKLPKQKNAGFSKNPTKLQLDCSLDN
jgi:hypothetical protein